MYHHGDLFLNTFVYTLMFYTSLYGEKPFPVTFFHVCHSALPQPSPTSPSATFPSLPTPLSEALQVFALRDPIKVSSSRFLLTPPIWWLQRRKRERGGGRRKLCGRGGGGENGLTHLSSFSKQVWKVYAQHLKTHDNVKLSIFGLKRCFASS